MVKLTYKGQEVDADLFEKLVQCGFELALKECEVAKKEAMFAPDIAEARIAIINPTREHELWRNAYTTRSASITGKSKGGNKVVAFSHIPTFDSALVKSVREKGLRHGSAGRMSLQMFHNVLTQEDNGVYIVDYDKLKSSKYGKMSLKDARKHIMLPAFVNGQTCGERYLDSHQKVYGDNIYLLHRGDIEEGCAIWWALFVGNNGFNSKVDLNLDGRFLGLPTSAQNFSIGNEGLEAILGKGIAVRTDLVHLANIKRLQKPEQYRDFGFPYRNSI